MVQHYQFCDICEDPLDKDGAYTRETRCDACKLGMRAFSERALRVVENLMRRIKGLEDKLEERRDD